MELWLLGLPALGILSVVMIVTGRGPSQHFRSISHAELVKRLERLP